MYILENVWFTKLIKQFFFSIDGIVYNFISLIYDLLITIARTSILTQADISDMADRIYKLLAIFMIFKVTLSLITYVVNPDDFSDKSKGVAKLGTNIVISLAMLILTPYIFNYAYQFQAIILRDNSLATLIFGGNECQNETSFFNTAGDDMAYITMSAFLSPNLSIDGLHECSTLLSVEKSEQKCVEDAIKFNELCKTALTEKTTDSNFSEQTLKTYIAGVENNNLELLFRQDLVLATTENEDGEVKFIMDYKYIFSTVVGVVIILLLITFCMDVALRSIKLSFLQLIAPIPILSYVDPKSGKDGLFKKWYEMCLKTYVSLFVRLLALYFAVYIISRVADMKMVDIIDGSYQTNLLIAIFIIIGALMFAKQLPKILEGLGIKLDGDGKFTLNPLKKLEREALGGGLLKKPNEMLGKAGKGLLKAPLSAASLGGRKLMAGIDSARNGKGFWNGTKNVKSKMAQAKDKFMEKNLPHSFQKQKDIKAGRESLALKNQMYEQGGRLFKKYDDSGKDIADAFKSPEYRDSYKNVEKQKAKMYYWQQEVEKRKSALNAAEIEASNNDTPETRRKLEDARNALTVAMTNSGKTQAQYELSKAKHDDMKKIYRSDAEIEDSRDFYMKNSGKGLKPEYESSPVEKGSSSSSGSGSSSSSSINGSLSSSSINGSLSSSSDNGSSSSSSGSESSSSSSSKEVHIPKGPSEAAEREQQENSDREKEQRREEIRKLKSALDEEEKEMKSKIEEIEEIIIKIENRIYNTSDEAEKEQLKKEKEEKEMQIERYKKQIEEYKKNINDRINFLESLLN